MPRHKQLDCPGVIHHVIVRGIERRKLFRDKVHASVASFVFVNVGNGYSVAPDVEILYSLELPDGHEVVFPIKESASRRRSLQRIHPATELTAREKKIVKAKFFLRHRPSPILLV